MKKAVLALILTLISCSCAYAGLFGGSASGFTTKEGEVVVGTGGSITMFETPFSTVNVFVKYALTENIRIYGKAGGGAIDFSSVPTYEATKSPVVYSAGIEYRLSKEKDQSLNLVLEQELADWAVNSLDNRATCTTVGLEQVRKLSETGMMKIRLAAFLSDAGDNPGPKILSSTRFGLITENIYNFPGNIGGYFEGGILFGDIEGVLVYFGAGATLNILR